MPKRRTAITMDYIMNMRSTYTGTYANFASKITLDNDVPKISNEEILKLAKETKTDFYRDALEAIKRLDAKTKK